MGIYNRTTGDFESKEAASAILIHEFSKEKITYSSFVRTRYWHDGQQ